MVVGDRVRERMESAGLSQAELARRVGVAQPTVFKVAHGQTYGSRHLPKIARELGTTLAYLTGETDDPAGDAALPVPALPYQFVSFPLAIPNEDALARMFEGLLAPLDLTEPKDVLARMLAQLLPIGLSQVRDLLPRPAPHAVPGAHAPPPPSETHSPPPGQRT